MLKTDLAVNEARFDSDVFGSYLKIVGWATRDFWHMALSHEF